MVSSPSWRGAAWPGWRTETMEPPQALGRPRRSSKKNRENLVRESITALHASCRGRAARCAAALFLFIRPRSPTHPALTVFTTRFSHLAPFPVICYFSTQSPHDEQGRPMHWDPHNGKWVSGEGKEPSLRDRSFHDRDPDSPARKRAASPAPRVRDGREPRHQRDLRERGGRGGEDAQGPARGADAARGFGADAGRRPRFTRLARPPAHDQHGSVVQGLSRAESASMQSRSARRLVLASGQPISSSQLAFKSKPASGKGLVWAAV